MTEMANGTARHIDSRLVLFFPGFEPLGAGQHRGRFGHALKKKPARFMGPTFPQPGLKPPVGNAGFQRVRFRRWWHTQTDVVVFDWSPVLDHFASRNVLVRFGSGLIALFGFIIRGTLFRYLKTSWRYGLSSPTRWSSFLAAHPGLAGGRPHRKRACRQGARRCRFAHSPWAWHRKKRTFF